MDLIEQLVAIRNVLDLSLIHKKKTMLHAHAVLTMGRTTLRAFGWNVMELHIGDMEEDPDNVIVYLDVVKTTNLPALVKSVKAHIEHVEDIEIMDIQCIFADNRRVNYDIYSHKIRGVTVNDGDLIPVRELPVRLGDMYGIEPEQLTVMCMLHDVILNRFEINSSPSYHLGADV